MRALSQYYQGLDLMDPIPSFTKHIFPSPTLQLIDRMSSEMLHLVNTHPPTELGKLYASMNQDVVTLQWKFSGQHLRWIRESTSNTAHSERNGSRIRLSMQDCLSAYMIDIVNRFTSIPIVRVTNAASVGDHVCAQRVRCLCKCLVPSR